LQKQEDRKETARQTAQGAAIRPVKLLAALLDE
jgi:hypothetical protein